MTQELEAQALAILDSLVSTPFDQCIPITRAFKNVTASASIYAVRHQELGLLYMGKTRSAGSGFEMDIRRFSGLGSIATILMMSDSCFIPSISSSFRRYHRL